MKRHPVVACVVALCGTFLILQSDEPREVPVVSSDGTTVCGTAPGE